VQGLKVEALGPPCVSKGARKRECTHERERYREYVCVNICTCMYVCMYICACIYVHLYAGGRSENRGVWALVVCGVRVCVCVFGCV